MNSMAAMDIGRASQQGPENTHEATSDAAYVSTQDATQVTHEAAYEAAKELAASYTDLLLQRESYKEKLGEYPHYTLDDVYYLLTQGAHAQTERVRSSGCSDPVFKTVANAEKVMHRLNAEMDAEYRKEVVEPYQEICEKIHLFELCLDHMGALRRCIADQLYVQGKCKKDVTDTYGHRMTRKALDGEIENIISELAQLIIKYREYRNVGGKRMVFGTGDGGTSRGKKE